MATLYPAPSESAIEVVLAGLVPVGVRVSGSRAADPERDASGVFAEFVTASDELGVVGFADPAVVNLVGGAMMGIDEERLADAVAKQMVLDDGLEGFREVANVFASCLNTDFTPHLRLASVHRLPGPLSDAVKQLWRQPRGRRAYTVSVEEQGEGTLVFYIG